MLYGITHPCPNCNGGLAKPPLMLGEGWVISSLTITRFNYLSKLWYRVIFLGKGFQCSILLSDISNQSCLHKPFSVYQEYPIIIGINRHAIKIEWWMDSFWQHRLISNPREIIMATNMVISSMLLLWTKLTNPKRCDVGRITPPKVATARSQIHRTHRLLKCGF